MERIQKRFQELSAKGDDLFHKIRAVDPSYEDDRVWAAQVLVEWRTSAESLLFIVLGKAHPVSVRFDEMLRTEDSTSVDSLWSLHNNLLPIFNSAKEQFVAGHLVTIKNLASAAVFLDELEQAYYLQSNGYLLPAAVISGTVLESTLRQLCEQSPDINLPDKPKANWMLQKLRENNVFSVPEQTQILTWMQIRNQAAHGKSEFSSVTANEIENMIDGIRDFVSKHMK